MSGRELFGVCVRLLGLLLVLHGAGRLLAFLFTVPAARPSIEGGAFLNLLLICVFEVLAGLFLFLKASLIELLAYPERRD